MTTILFTSDVHGNITQYEKLIQYAQQSKAESVIIGGDIAPKKFHKRPYVKGQRDFFTADFPHLMERLKETGVKIYLMMGNDDASNNLDILSARKDLYDIIHGSRVQFQNGLDIVGYSHVPISPFNIKDWEKYDLSTVTPEYNERKQQYRLDGMISKKRKWKPFIFDPAIEQKDSIQKDLESEIYRSNPQDTIYVFHSPPNNTTLDMVKNGDHAGSFAIREFIEQEQPRITLHGHIHETVDISGSFSELIGTSHSYSCGNHHIGNHIHLIEFDPERVDKARRIKL